MPALATVTTPESRERRDKRAYGVNRRRVVIVLHLQETVGLGLPCRYGVYRFVVRTAASVLTSTRCPKNLNHR